MEATGTKASENVRGSIKIVPGEVPQAGQYGGQRGRQMMPETTKNGQTMSVCCLKVTETRNKRKMV